MHGPTWPCRPTHGRDGVSLLASPCSDAGVGREEDEGAAYRRRAASVGGGRVGRWRLGAGSARVQDFLRANSNFSRRFSSQGLPGRRRQRDSPAILEKKEGGLGLEDERVEGNSGERAALQQKGPATFVFSDVDRGRASPGEGQQPRAAPWALSGASVGGGREWGVGEGGGGARHPFYRRGRATGGRQTVASANHRRGQRQRAGGSRGGVRGLEASGRDTRRRAFSRGVGGRRGVAARLAPARACAGTGPGRASPS
jgi:hypothetical protein